MHPLGPLSRFRRIVLIALFPAFPWLSFLSWVWLVPRFWTVSTLFYCSRTLTFLSLVATNTRTVHRIHRKWSRWLTVSGRRSSDWVCTRSWAKRRKVSSRERVDQTAARLVLLARLSRSHSTRTDSITFPMPKHSVVCGSCLESTLFLFFVVVVVVIYLLTLAFTWELYHRYPWQQPQPNLPDLRCHCTSSCSTLDASASLS